MEALGINLGSLITSVVSFLVLFGLLHVVLYKPILKVLDKRSARIKESLETAERIKKDYARSEEDIRTTLEKARTESQSMITQARETAERFREGEMAKVREAIATEHVKAKANIEQEKEAAIEELRREFATLALTAAERVVERSIDKPTHKDIIEKVLEQAPRIRLS